MEQKPVSLTEQAYKYLEEKIQNCEYMPGFTLNEREICDEIKCGRTPVREALLSLRQQGLIEIYPRRAIQVSRFTHQRISEIYQIRKLLEPAVCEKYFSRLDKAELLRFDALFESVDRQDDRAYYGLDIKFHKWLVAAAENRTLDVFFAELMRVQYRFGVYSARIGTAIKHDYYTEHHDIIQALLAEEPERIARTLINHANYSQVIALKTLELAQKGL